MNYFEKLNAINVNDKTEKRMDLLICHGHGRGENLRSYTQAVTTQYMRTQMAGTTSPMARLRGSRLGLHW